jgi:hypothetical protein
MAGEEAMEEEEAMADLVDPHQRSGFWWLARGLTSLLATIGALRAKMKPPPGISCRCAAPRTTLFQGKTRE